MKQIPQQEKHETTIPPLYVLKTTFSHLTLSIIEGGNETVGKAGARRGVPEGRWDLLLPVVVSTAEVLGLLLSPRW